MARVRISEYAAKRLFVGDQYRGISIDSSSDLSALALETGTYVVKVDDGTKKRNKKGLVTIGVSEKDAVSEAQRFLEAGFARVLIEPIVPHTSEAERYLSCTLTRSGVAVLYSETGGNEIEEHGDRVQRVCIDTADFMKGIVPASSKVPTEIVGSVLDFMKQHHVSFIEINPFILWGVSVICLDCAVEIDSAKLHMLPTWVSEHLQGKRVLSEAEQAVKRLDAESVATFSLTVFDTNAAVFTLLSGGGASLVVLDEMVAHGKQAAVANYGEYSGAPSREETCRYTEELLKLLCTSSASQKILLIAGGVANFTDIVTTCEGIIDACTLHLEALQKQPLTVIVRRGGPRQALGLKRLRDFFAENEIEAVISGPEVTLSETITSVCDRLN